MTNNTNNATNEYQSAYAFKDGKIIHISSVQRGLDCECSCPSCGTPLIARKGDKNIHHFAHQDGELNSCSESLIHKLGKQIISEHMKIQIPPLGIKCEQQDILGRTFSMGTEDSAYSLLFSEVLLEETPVGANFRPDITGKNHHSTTFIEVVVTNPVSEEKLAQVKEWGIPMLSLDLSSCSPMDSIEEITQKVLYDAPRTWAYHPDYNSTLLTIQDRLVEQIERENESVKRVVMEEYRLTELDRPIEPPKFKPKNFEVIVMGYKSAHGYSPKKSRNFDFSLLTVSKPLDTNQGSKNFTLRAKGGYETEALSFAESLTPKLESIAFPCIAELELKHMYIGGKAKLVVTDIVLPER